MRDNRKHLETISRKHSKRIHFVPTGSPTGTQVTTELLLDMLRAQKWLCIFCGASIRPNYWMDHIIPITRGGQHVMENIQFTCRHCNLSKGNRRSKPKTIRKPMPLVSYYHIRPEDRDYLNKLLGREDYE